MTEEAKTIVCAECGEAKPVSNYQMTRWGHLTKVCKACVMKKRNGSIKEKKENVIEILRQQVDESRKLRLKDFTPRELMTELRERGYDGTLKFVQVKEFKLSDL